MTNKILAKQGLTRSAVKSILSSKKRDAILYNTPDPETENEELELENKLLDVKLKETQDELISLRRELASIKNKYDDIFFKSLFLKRENRRMKAYIKHIKRMLGVPRQ